LRQVNVKEYVGIFRYITCRFYAYDYLSITNAAGTLLYYTSAYALAGMAALALFYM
jgi:NADH-quinone oxidoreductase subunit N